MGDDQLVEVLVAAVPEFAALLEQHHRAYGGAQPFELFGDAMWFCANWWSEGRSSAAKEVLAFMDHGLGSGDDRLRDCVIAGFLAPIVSAPSSPGLDAFVAAWPESLRRELETRRSARRLLTEGVWIEATDDTEAIEVVWVIEDVPAAVASDGVAAYVVGDAVHAIGVADGRLLWRYGGHDGVPLEVSGGVTIATTPDGHLQAYAPFDFLLHLDMATGVEVYWDDGDEDWQPRAASPFPAFPLTDFAVHDEAPRTLRIDTAEGATLATLTVAESSYDCLPPMQINDVLVLTLPSGHVVGIRRASPASGDVLGLP